VSTRIEVRRHQAASDVGDPRLLQTHSAYRYKSCLCRRPVTTAGGNASAASGNASAASGNASAEIGDGKRRRRPKLICMQQRGNNTGWD
jgi:hypothetical protein